MYVRPHDLYPGDGRRGGNLAIFTQLYLSKLGGLDEFGIVDGMETEDREVFLYFSLFCFVLFCFIPVWIAIY